MTGFDEILAKSPENGGAALLEHTKHIAETITFFAEKFAYDFDPELARKGAVLHDLGKAHPHFQRKIRKIKAKSMYEERQWKFTHRHELSSLAFLPVFPEEEWPTLIDLVVAHHKPIENDPGDKGILDLDHCSSEWIENHLLAWEEWSVHGFEILEAMGYPAKSISKEEAKETLLKVTDYCFEKGFGISPLRGLLRAADHFSSAFGERTSEKLKSLFKVPDLSFYFAENRISDLFPLSKIQTNDERPHTLVVAPTGAGKTDFLLKRTRGRIFYTLPFQASINSMFERFRDTVKSGDIRLLHSTSKIVVGNNIDEKILQPLSGSSVKVLTPHQLAALIFGTAGFESVMLDVKGTDVILDEIHTYSDFSRAMVIEIVKTLLRLGCRVHIGTATMPSVLYEKLFELLGGTEKVFEVKLPNEVLDSFDRHEVFKLDSEEEIFPVLEKALRRKEKVLVIYNTVKAAQDAFKEFQNTFSDVNKMLIHSRFRRGDRVRLEKRLTKEFNESQEACLVVSTQVVEVSLDISFDRMITQCAPLDSLIQRFGRVNRKRSPKRIGKYKPVHVLQPSGNALPYKSDVLQASFDALPEQGKLLNERTLQEKIDAVYPVLDMQEIDIFLIYKDGKYRIRELCNHRKGVLIDALQIDSANCILECDAEEYHDCKNWEKRLQMEIPINYRSLYGKKDDFAQLDVGSNPFVVPQDFEEYEQYGLKLIYDNFI